MIKLKYKVPNEGTQVFECETVQEVAELIKQICEASTLAEVLKVQKEYNLRFYITRTNGKA